MACPLMHLWHDSMPALLFLRPGIGAGNPSGGVGVMLYPKGFLLDRKFTKLKPLAYGLLHSAEAEDWIRICDAFADTCTWPLFVRSLQPYFPRTNTNVYERRVMGDMSSWIERLYLGSTWKRFTRLASLFELLGDAQRQARHFKWGPKELVGEKCQENRGFTVVEWNDRPGQGNYNQRQHRSQSTRDSNQGHASGSAELVGVLIKLPLTADARTVIFWYVRQPELFYHGSSPLKSDKLISANKSRYLDFSWLQGFSWLLYGQTSLKPKIENLSVVLNSPDLRVREQDISKTAFRTRYGPERVLDGIIMDPSKVEAITKWPRLLRDGSESFLGFAGNYPDVLLRVPVFSDIRDASKKDQKKLKGTTDYVFLMIRALSLEGYDEANSSPLNYSSRSTKCTQRFENKPLEIPMWKWDEDSMSISLRFATTLEKT
ncbi:hypothetical protein Tco_0322562 [Tanacetum coccineum]